MGTDWRNRLEDAAAGSFASFADKVLFSSAIRRIYNNAQGHSGKSLLEALLAEMKVRIKVTADDLNRIPRQGPVLVVCNHPFGILDGVVLGATLLRIRPDVKIVTNNLLQGIPELQHSCIFVDPFNRRGSRHANAAGLKRAIAYLRAGGMVAVFPAGEVSHWQPQHREVTDPEWNPSVAMLARVSDAAVLPAMFQGRNSISFQTLGMIHPLIRTLSLPQEFVNKSGHTVDLSVGAAIPAERLRRIPNDAAVTTYLRWRTYLLKNRGRCQPRGKEPFVFPFVRSAPFKAVAAEVAPCQLLAEITALAPGRIIDETRDFSVFTTEAMETPALMLEIGRLRELTFRQAGEGTGRERDLDKFDHHYKHLVLWHKEKQQVVGSYRFANVQEVLANQGAAGLYTSTLFTYHPRFLQGLGPALELGRSFIRGEFQKHYSPLLLLWKGMARYVAAHPETPVLFGAVSISNDYEKASRELLVQFFQSQPAHPLTRLVRPKRMFRPQRWRSWELQSLRDLLDIEEVSASIANIEQDGKGIPVLLRQYLKLGGELLGFNVDRNFSNVLDGLIVVDLRKADPTRLATYMGQHGLSAFRRYHKLSADFHGT